MRTHLEDDVLLDVIEGSASVEAVRHVDECRECAERVAEARAGFSLASAADAPDPSPLFWEHFPRRVASRIEAERPARRFGGFLAPALLATAATVAVQTALTQVPEEFRVAVVLCDLYRVPYADAAQILEVPVGTVKSRVFRGRSALADRLTDPTEPTPARPPLRVVNTAGTDPRSPASDPRDPDHPPGE